MPSQEEPRPSSVAHYDEAYYASHYGALLNDDSNYRLLSLFWRYLLFERNHLGTGGNVLDFGCGLGQVSAALPNTLCFDVSPFARAELRKRNRTVVDRPEQIPHSAFDYLLSSHSLEHSPSPHRDLEDFRQYVRPTGRMVLVLPIETRRRPTLKPDWDQHLQAWTFQTITNLLCSTGWLPLAQSVVHGPFFLRTLGRHLPAETAVWGAYWVGRLRRWYPSMLTIARLR